MVAINIPVRRFAEFDNVVDLVWLRDRMRTDAQLKSWWDVFSHDDQWDWPPGSLTGRIFGPPITIIDEGSD